MFPTPNVADSGAQLSIDLTDQQDDRIIQQAIALLEHRVFKAGPTLDGPKAVRDYLRLKLMAEPNEVFVVVFLNSQHQVLACECLFKGTVSEASVYPRVVVQRALELNASALIMSHYVARHIMWLMCPIFLCAQLGRLGRIFRLLAGIRPHNESVGAT